MSGYDLVLSSNICIWKKGSGIEVNLLDSLVI
jgi:hypothetical protein